MTICSPARSALQLSEGTTLTALIEDSLRRALAPPGAPPRTREPLATFRGDGLQPGVDLDDTAALLDLMDGRHAGA